MTKARIEFVSENGRPIGLWTKFDLLRKELRSILDEDAKRWLPDQEFLGQLSDITEEFLSDVENYSNYDPTPTYLYDNTGGEPPLSADERWQAAFDQKQELHR